MSQHLLRVLSIASVASAYAISNHGQRRSDHSSRATAFEHPGLLHSDADFERICSKVDAKAEPWYTGWEKLTANANKTYIGSPEETVIRGVNADAGAENYANLFRDIAAAYALAIRWRVEDDSSYADAAVQIMDDWSSTLKNVTGSSDKFLAAGIYGYQLANVAEVLRSYSGWDKLDDTISMLQNIFYPLSHDFLLNHNGAEIDHYWANWDLCNIAAVQAIGILSDNTTMYNEAVDYYKNGQGNGQIEKAIWKLYDDPDAVGKQLGQCQESGRDQGHAMLNFALHGVIAKQSWSQGDDLFGYLDSRILAGAEYSAKYNLNISVPYTTYENSDVTQSAINATDRGDVRPIWELLYAHYGSLKGQNASWSENYRDYINEQSGGAEGGGGDYSPNSGGYDQLGYGTLLYRLD